MTQVNAKLHGLVRGKFRRIDVLQRGTSPRIVRAQIVGTKGTTPVTGPQLRSPLRPVRHVGLLHDGELERLPRAAGAATPPAATDPGPAATTPSRTTGGAAAGGAAARAGGEGHAARRARPAR